jgi:hypothetical protein
MTGLGGTIGAGGTTGSGGTSASGGTGGTSASGGTGGTSASGGSIGATGHGGTTGSGGTTAAAGHGGTTGSGGTSATAGTTGSGGSTTVDCSATFPSGGNTQTGTNVNGTADGLGYGIWTNGSGGSITTFSNAHAFSASWNNSMDFLAHLGLDFNKPQPYTSYGTITAEFSEIKSGNVCTGTNCFGYSSIGLYGWMHSPCIEWYINEDSYSTYIQSGTAVMIDGDMYYLATSMTTGTGGANACEAGHTGGWTNITATRATHRQCGTINVSDHFASWAAQGWTLGSLASVHINVEVGGGVGSIQFPVANVTATSN